MLLPLRRGKKKKGRGKEVGMRLGDDVTCGGG
jgi:hypothetical protein